MKTASLYLLFLSALLLTACGGPKVDRSLVPQPAPAPATELGKYEKFELDNGLKVIVVENHKLPSVSFQLTVDRGPVLEGEKAGTAELAGSLLGAGSRSMSKAKIDEEIDFIGATLNTYATGAFASGLSKHKEAILEIMAEVVLHPQFPKKEVEKERTRKLSGLVSEKTNPDAISANLTSVMNFGSDHPYGEVVTERTVENITRNDIQNYYQTYFKPNISYLVMVGDITRSQARDYADTYFGDWKSGKVTKREWPSPARSNIPRVALAPLDGAVQSVIDITFPVDLKPGSVDEIPADVLNNILGGSTFSARLLDNLREDKAYTYGAYSSLDADPVMGSFSARTSVRNEVTDSAITEIMKEIRRIIREPVADSTLQFMKNWMTGTFTLRLESPQTIARYALNIERYGLKPDYYQRYLERLNKVTAADIQRVAKVYLKPNTANITVVGNRSEVADKLEAFGEVNLFGIYGQPYAERQPAPKGVTAESVIADFVKARGGVDALEGVASYQAEGSMNMQGMEMPFESAMKDNTKLRMQVQFMGQTAMEQVFNGKEGKLVQMGEETPMDETLLQQMVYQADMLFEHKLAEYGVTAELLGVEQVDGTEAYVVQLMFPGGGQRTDYFSVKSGLRIREVETNEIPGSGPITSTTIYKEYMEVDGVQFAKSIQQLAGPQTIDISYSSVKTNVKITDSAFEVK